MWRVISLILAGSLCVLPAAVSSDPEATVYRKLGDDVVLRPGSSSETITNIVWKDGANIAVQWDGADIDMYRHFEERSYLNVSSGELTITGLVPDDSGVYTAEINNVVASLTRLAVLAPVPTPTVKKSCNTDKTSCTLTCDANTTGAEPVTYRWRLATRTESTKELSITKDDAAGVTEFICELQNPVSLETSQALANPLLQGLNVSAGVTVFCFLLTTVLLLVFIHRWKSGEWFFQKAAMPWKADFWRREDGQRRDRSAEANGTTALQQTEEETPMK